MQIEECPGDEAEARISRYLQTFANHLSPVESFVEERLLGSRHFKLSVGDDRRDIGLFSIEKAAVLTHFEVDDEHAGCAKDAFLRATSMLNVQEALVPTFDEEFLALAFDCHRSVKLQAYLFREGTRGEPSPSVPNLNFELARPADQDLVASLAGDFFDKLDERLARHELQIARLDGAVCGFGIMETGQFVPLNASIGMFVLPEFRGRHVARSILHHLRNQAHGAKLRPVAGCWYYNHASHRALQGAGMVASSRLLRFTF